MGLGYLTSFVPFTSINFSNFAKIIGNENLTIFLIMLKLCVKLRIVRVDYYLVVSDFGL